jgi:hypothetical protein
MGGKEGDVEVVWRAVREVWRRLLGEVLACFVM